MKLLMATHYFGSHRGGIELVAERLFREFAALGQDVVWMATDATPPPDAKGTARVVSLRAYNFIERKIGVPFPIPTLGALTCLRKEVRRAEVVILHDCLYLTNLAAFVFARLNRVPVIIVQHIGLVPYRNRLLKGLMSFANALVTRRMLRRAQHVIFISETTKRYFGNVPFRTPPAVIFNGVDGGIFRTLGPTENRASLRSSFGLPPDRPVVLFVGRFVEKKGLAILSHMVERAPDYTWAFAGWGAIDPRQWQAANVHVFPDLRGPRLADLYRASDLFVLPATGEGLPLVVQEALASGLPVVCSSEIAAADSAMRAFVRSAPLQPGDDASSAAAFLAIITDLIKSGPKLAEGAEERRKFALARFCWRSAAEQYLAIVSRVAAEAPHSVPEKSTEHCAGSGNTGP